MVEARSQLSRDDRASVFRTSEQAIADARDAVVQPISDGGRNQRHTSGDDPPGASQPAQDIENRGGTAQERAFGSAHDQTVWKCAALGFGKDRKSTRLTPVTATSRMPSSA